MAQDNGFSFSEIAKLVSDGHAEIMSLGKRTADVAELMQMVQVGFISATEKNLDEWQSLVAAAGRLAELLSAEGTR